MVRLILSSYYQWVIDANVDCDILILSMKGMVES